MIGEGLALVGGETARDREAVCMVGGAAVGNCVECPVVLSCPILQLKQRSEEVAPTTTELPADDGQYNSDGGGVTDITKQPTLPAAASNIVPKVQERGRATVRQLAVEKAAQARMNQHTTVPQKKPNQPPTKRTYLELLMDSVVEFVVADSIRKR